MKPLFSMSTMGLTLVLALILAACSPAGYNLPGAAQATQAVVPATGGGGIKVASDSKLGQILTDSNGKTLYIFMNDAPGTSTCSDSCLVIWPALVASGGQPPGVDPAVSGQVGTISRSDGSTQVTINGLPLYTFTGDTKPGDVTGEALYDFNGYWYAVKPDGTLITGG